MRSTAVQHVGLDLYKQLNKPYNNVRGLPVSHSPIIKVIIYTHLIRPYTRKNFNKQEHHKAV